MKKYFAYAFILIGLLVSIVSCAPIVRAPFSRASANIPVSDFSLLGAAMLLAFASLSTIVGIIMYARRFVDDTDPSRVPRLPRWSATLLNLSPLALFLGAPMAHMLIPLWVARRSGDHAGRLNPEAMRILDFQITWTLFVVVALMLTVVLVGFVLLAILVVFNLAVITRAAWRSWHGAPATFPLSLTFVATRNR